jgi:hypothetical protein
MSFQSPHPAGGVNAPMPFVHRFHRREIFSRRDIRPLEAPYAPLSEP